MKFFRVGLWCYVIIWSCVAFSSMLLTCSCILGLCDWLYIVSAVVWVGFLPMMQFYFARYMLMHSHALFFSSLSFMCIVSIVFFFCSFLSFWLLHPRNPLPWRTQYLVMVLHLLLFILLEIGSVIRNPKRILMRNFVTGRFIWNAKSFCLTF